MVVVVRGISDASEEERTMLLVLRQKSLVASVSELFILVVMFNHLVVLVIVREE